VGEVYQGRVVRILSNMGAFIELLPGKDGLLHISKMANERVEKVEDVLNIGDEVEVKVAEIDSQGRVNLLRTDIVYNQNRMSRPTGDRNRPPRRDGRSGQYNQ
jgi:polyribonucleotide nucleotidyltransferase